MILGIDYGLKNIGLAISEGSLAEPYETIKIRDEHHGIKEIEMRVKKLGISEIVVGISEGKSRVLAEEFGNNLKNVLGLPIKFVDETLTTYEAGGKDHAKAAAIILQRYLDNN